MLYYLMIKQDDNISDLKLYTGHLFDNDQSYVEYIYLDTIMKLSQQKN